MKIRYKFILISYFNKMNYVNSIEDLIIPNKQKWIDFYNICKKNNNLNIACAGPHDSCKSTMIRLIINDFINKNKKLDKEKIVLHVNVHDEVQMFQNNNKISIFCKNQLNNDKIVYIENFDDMNEQNQQELKYYMDKYNIFKDNCKIHFIIETSGIYKMKDFIQSRFQIFETSSLGYDDLYKILNNLVIKNNMKIEKNTLSFIKQKSNITITSLIIFIKKINMLNITNISYMVFNDYYQNFDDSIFYSYFAYIDENNFKEASKILFELYYEGYDLSDIYSFMFNFVKQITKYYYTIDVICFYINEYYNGKYDKCFILFLTQDLINKKLLIINEQ